MGETYFRILDPGAIFYALAKRLREISRSKEMITSKESDIAKRWDSIPKVWMRSLQTSLFKKLF